VVMFLFYKKGQDCLFLRLICWVVWQMTVALPYWTALWELSSGCLSPRFLSGVGLLEQAGSQKWSHERLVNEKLSAPSSHRASLWVRNELFSCKTHFHLAPGFSKAV
jgi:hypothetical protein